MITGSELDQLNSIQVDQLCKYEEIVFARTTPEQKLRIVHEFKRRSCVVAMTGDGVNDAPSLKAADCSFIQFVNARAGSDFEVQAVSLWAKAQMLRARLPT